MIYLKLGNKAPRRQLEDGQSVQALNLQNFGSSEQGRQKAQTNFKVRSVKRHGVRAFKRKTGIPKLCCQIRKIRKPRPRKFQRSAGDLLQGIRQAFFDSLGIDKEMNRYEGNQDEPEKDS